VGTLTGAALFWGCVAAAFGRELEELEEDAGADFTILLASLGEVCPYHA
jgi:hypothetical protein